MKKSIKILLAALFTILSLYYLTFDHKQQEGVVLEQLPAQSMQVELNYGRIPLHFEPNTGQAEDEAIFLARGSGYNLSLTSTEAIFTLSKTGNKSKLQSHILRMKLAGANPSSKVEGLDVLPGKSNYLLGSDPEQWHTGVANYARVKYSEVYPGIDLIYYGNQQQLEYDFVVAPEVDPGSIVMEFDGAERIELDESGNLWLQTGNDHVILQAPIIYQKTLDGSKQMITGAFEVRTEKQVGFRIGEYDPDLALVIDPVLTYSTYLGGGGGDRGNDIAIDTAGNAYITGETGWFTMTENAAQNTKGGMQDVFVAKLSADGSELLYATYIGGSLDDRGLGIAVDADGNAYVTGETESDDFPTIDAAQSDFGGSLWVDGDAFVTKLNSDGSAFLYSTYLGGGVEDIGRDIAVDSNGNAYIVGHTFSSDFPTENSLQPDLSDYSDVFVTKLSVTGSFLFSTYLSFTPWWDEGMGIALDNHFDIYLTGVANHDVFVAKMKTNGSALTYTYIFGGGGLHDEPIHDEGTGIAVNSQGEAYVTGTTSTSDFPTTKAVQPNSGGGRDCFVSKVAADGSKLLFSTYLGGTAYEDEPRIALDAESNAYIAGDTQSGDFPILNPLQETLNGFIDAFITQISADGSEIIFSTFLGGSGWDRGRGIAVSDGTVYVTGDTDSDNFPVETPLQAGRGGFSDAFIVRIGDSMPALQVTAETLLRAGESATIEARIIDPATGMVQTEINGTLTLTLLSEQSTPGIGTFLDPQVAIKNGVADEAIFLTPEEILDENAVITPATVLAGVAVIEAKIDESNIPPATLTIDVKSPFDFFIEDIEIQQGVVGTDQQVIQEFSPGVDKTFPALPFIAEHNTAVRLIIGYESNLGFEPEPGRIQGIPGIWAKLKIFRDGNEIKTLDRIETLTKPFILQGSYSLDEKFEFKDALATIISHDVLKQPGTYTFEAELNFDSNLDEMPGDKLNNTHSASGIFTETKPFKILAFAGAFADEPDYPTVSDVAWDFTRNTYPVQHSKLDFADPNSNRLPIPRRFEGNPSEFIDYLDQILIRHNADNPGDQRDKIVVLASNEVVRTIRAIADNEQVGGFTGGLALLGMSHASLVSAAGDNKLAHEMGHLLGLGDTYDNDAALPADATNPKRSDATQHGNRVEEGNIDFDLETRAIGGGFDYFDFMGDDDPGNSIITLRAADRVTWNHLYQTQFRATGGKGKAVPAQAEEFIAVSGIIDKNFNIVANPFVSLPQIPGPVQLPGGEVAIEFMDADGSMLSSFGFDPVYFIPDAGPTEKTSFSFYLPLPAEAREVKFMKEGIELSSRTFSKNPPEIEINSPAPGQTLDKVTTITWTASDPDDDELTYDLLYSPDGQRQIVLDMNVQDTAWQWDTSQVDEEYSLVSLTVIASDGLNESRAESHDLFLSNALFVSIDTPGQTDLPVKTVLHQNYPNPFNPETRIQYDLPKATHVRIEIFNILGQKVRTLVDAQKQVGSHETIWDSRNDFGQPVATGMYIYRMITTDVVTSKKLLLLR